MADPDCSQPFALQVFPSYAEQFAGCVGPGGQIAQVECGDIPLRGQCSGQRSGIGIASVTRLGVPMDKSAIFERVLVKELGPFRIEEFMRQAGAGVQFASLKEISSSWRREDFVEEGGWAMVADEEYDNAAELCAERLMTMEAPVTQEAVSTDTGTVAQ